MFKLTSISWGQGALTLICTLIFARQAYHCTKEFLYQTPITTTSVDNQEFHPLPSICVSLQYISEEKSTKHNISSYGHMHEGKWKSVLPNYDEEQTYDDLSASFYDLIEAIEFYKEVNSRSEAYDVLVFSAINMTLPIGRCDYYGVQKCYCIHLADVENSFGIQEVILTLKRNVEITIAPKNQFYEYVRKLNIIYAGPDFNYQYNIAHSVYKRLPNTCSHTMDWKSDECKLAFLHEKIYSALNCTTPWLLFYSR